MPCLYVTEHDSTVRLSGQSLLVTSEAGPNSMEGHEHSHRQTLLEVESHRLEVVALVGRAHITSIAVHFCLENGIAVAWFSWSGKYLGRIVPDLSRSADLRLRQYEEVHDARGRQARARKVVDAKLANSLEVLQDIRSNDSTNDLLAEAMAELARLRVGLKDAGTPEQLLGMEGTGARIYFNAYGSSFRGEITFQGRERHPPPDPANALLSFAYVLLGNRIGGMLEARGLDAALGFFHEPRSGRPSLALDLLEELRAPVVDRFVLRACNLRIFRPEMFEPDAENPGGVRLTHDALKIFFREWEKHLLHPLREQGAEPRLAVLPLVQRQIERWAADLRGGPAYEPFHYGG